MQCLTYQVEGEKQNVYFSKYSTVEDIDMFFSRVYNSNFRYFMKTNRRAFSIGIYVSPIALKSVSVVE